jgi:CxxC motif-containing protein (DUF1111 family)
LGGWTSAFNETEVAFNLSARNIGLDDRIFFGVGDVVFEHFFSEDDGLGPGFNADGCTSCHVNNGKGAIPTDDGPVFEIGPVAKIGFPGLADEVPGFGTQLQTDGPGAEGTLSVTWSEEPGEFPDGTRYSLRRPSWTVGGLPDGAAISVRSAPMVAGTGLLEAIDAGDIRALADAEDADGDGISGRTRELGDDAIGRFGWRANQPTVRAQTAGAFAEDMGISSPDRLAPGDSEPEISEEDLYSTEFYTRTLAMPVMRDTDDPEVLTGRAVFEQIGCADCHAPTFVTGRADSTGLINQTIYPYTDMLLHDMGEGLADELDEPGESGALGSEWRTPPLWGLGLHEVVNGNTEMLHDGRARTFAEAILWHDGEAEAVRGRYLKLDTDQRSALEHFLAAL